jgi:sugar O-acyltransferase (sialic acid O-acetyltransferase NeuD family)
MEQVVVYGNGQVAGLAHYYLTHDSEYEVVAFTVESSFIKEATLEGLPVVSVEEALSQYPPETYKMFVAIGYGRVNKEREERYEQAKAMGYQLISYVSSKATIWPGVVIGENCFIMEGNIIQPFAKIGNDVVMWSACHVGHETVIQDHCFLSAHSVVSGNVTIEPNCFLGVNCTIRNSITLRRESVIGAGAVITKDTKERGVYAAPRVEPLALTSDRLPGL